MGLNPLRSVKLPVDYRPVLLTALYWTFSACHLICMFEMILRSAINGEFVFHRTQKVKQPRDFPHINSFRSVYKRGSTVLAQWRFDFSRQQTGILRVQGRYHLGRFLCLWFYWRLRRRWQILPHTLRAERDARVCLAILLATTGLACGSITLASLSWLSIAGQLPFSSTFSERTQG